MQDGVYIQDKGHSHGARTIPTPEPFVLPPQPAINTRTRNNYNTIPESNPFAPTQKTRFNTQYDKNPYDPTPQKTSNGSLNENKYKTKENSTPGWVFFVLVILSIFGVAYIIEKYQNRNTK